MKKKKNSKDHAGVSKFHSLLAPLPLIKDRGVVKDRGVEIQSKKLQGREIAIAIGGGIASIESVKIIRELRRHSAHVTPFMSPASQKFVTPLAVEWAAGRSPVLVDGPGVEYLEPFDLVLVCPATLNTLAKSASGITDTVVLLLLASQLGRKGKILFVPTMNETLFSHPLYEQHRHTLLKWGAEFLESPLKENRMKMPERQQITAKVIEILT